MDPGNEMILYGTLTAKKLLLLKVVPTFKGDNQKIVGIVVPC